METARKKLSVIIPAYNEEPIISQTIEELKRELNQLNLDYEIIVVNDCSKDRTKEILENIEGIKLINHPYNKGYGASLKNGVRKAQYDLLLFFDADGQHPTASIGELLQYTDDFEMVTGARIKSGYKGPILRRPGKKILRWVANYLTGQKIPDLNCGFRIVNREEIKKFLHILPNGFSLSTTSLIAFLKEGINIKFVPIEIKKRIGKSLVKPSDALRMFLLIIRIIFLFSPLKFFLPVSLALFLGTLASLIYDIFFRPLNITDMTVVLFISFLFISFFGLLADQLAAVRREIK